MPVFPAGAGVIRVPGFVETVVSSFPRRCGGDPQMLVDNVLDLEFSPQVRG